MRDANMAHPEKAGWLVIGLVQNCECMHDRGDHVRGALARKKLE
jgi:hypothetical protein